MTGAELLADIIARWSAPSDDAPAAVFHVPGEGALELLEALERARPSLRLVTCRHEAGMACMAQATGLLRKLPGICVAGRAPGALNAALALHTAFTDDAPMILIVGQAALRQAGREAFLGPEFAQAFAPMAKWVGEVTDARRLPEAMQRAWSCALSGRPGPVVLIVAEDVWAQKVRPPPPLPAPAPVESGVPAASAARIAALLAQARRPLLLVGGTGWQDEQLATLRSFAEASRLPVLTAYRNRDLIAAESPAMCGELGIGADPALLVRVAEADLLLVAGMRLGELDTFGTGGFAGFGLLDAPRPSQQLVHIHPDAAELNRVFAADLAVCAHPGGLFAQLPSTPQPGWREWQAQLRAARLAFTEGRPGRGPLDLRAVCTALRAALPPETVFAVGAGAYAHWPQRFLPHNRPRTCLGPRSGAMGYGLPAAIAAALAHPGRRAVALAGDGCLMMHAEELSTAVLYRLPVLVVVFNNASYGAIAASQRRRFGRETGAALAPVDFAALARAMGAEGWRVGDTQDFDRALQAALATDGPALIELMLGPDALTPA